jgi:hypothetical protein
MQLEYGNYGGCLTVSNNVFLLFALWLYYYCVMYGFTFFYSFELI